MFTLSVLFESIDVVLGGESGIVMISDEHVGSGNTSILEIAFAYNIERFKFIYNRYVHIIINILVIYFMNNLCTYNNTHDHKRVQTSMAVKPYSQNFS